MNDVSEPTALPEIGTVDSTRIEFWWTRGVLVFLAVVVVAVIVARVRLVEFPLERDEGEYAYGAQLLRHGGKLYTDLHTMKWPGCFGVYSLIFAIGGEQVAAIHSGLLVANLLAGAGLFLLAGQFGEKYWGAWAAVCYLVLSVLPAMHGFIANAEPFALLFSVFGLSCLMRSLRNESLSGLLAGGALLGVGAMMKQHAHAYVILGGSMCLLTPWPAAVARHWLRNILQAAVYSTGVLLMWGVMCLVVMQLGSWDDFVTWTIQYPRDYTSQIPLSKAPRIFLENSLPVLAMAWPILLLATAGLVGVFRSCQRFEQFWGTGLVVAGAISICPGFYFREHYFLMGLPAVAILCGLGVRELTRFARNAAGSNGWISATCACGVAVVLPLIIAGRPLFFMPLRELSRSMYGINLFVESPRIGEFLESEMNEQDRMVIFGSEPQLCFYSKRRMATGDIYMYPLTEIHSRARTMQEEMIQKVAAAKPKIAVYVSTPYSWLARDKSVTLLEDWIPGFLQDYQPIGFVSFVSMKASEYKFAGPGQTLHPRQFELGASPSSMLILRRRDRD